MYLKLGVLLKRAKVYGTSAEMNMQLHHVHSEMIGLFVKSRICYIDLGWCEPNR